VATQMSAQRFAMVDFMITPAVTGLAGIAIAFRLRVDRCRRARKRLNGSSRRMAR
jgi:hypothetical protein